MTERSGPEQEPKRREGLAREVATGRRSVAPLARLALSPDDAAASLGVSRDFFDEHILPELRVARRGRRRLVPLRELERWLEQNAAHTLAQERSEGWKRGGGRAAVRTSDQR